MNGASKFCSARKITLVLGMRAIFSVCSFPRGRIFFDKCSRARKDHSIPLNVKTDSNVRNSHLKDCF